MAKRKRLTPPQMTQSGTRQTAPSDGPAGVHRVAPIADMAGANAATAALQEVSEVLQTARERGRLIQPLLLERIDTGYLVRDRIADPDPTQEDMAALIDSLSERGQQTPIEVVALPQDRYGLISGWRRVQALKHLYKTTGEPRFATVLVVLRQPETAGDAYLAMVEENEIRVGLSHYERARIARKAMEQGVFETEKAALLALFRSGSRARRSKIRSFLTVVRHLDGVLAFPAALPERAGLALARALEDDPGTVDRVVRALRHNPPATAEAEQALLARVLRKPPDATNALVQAPVQTPAQEEAQEETPEPRDGAASGNTVSGDTTVKITEDIRMTRRADGHLTLSGAGIDAGLETALIDWLRRYRG